jgi:hypothetical protein
MGAARNALISIATTGSSSTAIELIAKVPPFGLKKLLLPDNMCEHLATGSSGQEATMFLEFCLRFIDFV